MALYSPITSIQTFPLFLRSHGPVCHSPFSLPRRETPSVCSASLSIAQLYCCRHVAPRSPAPVRFSSTRHGVNLFSLSSNAGSALAVALVQPGAAGLTATAAASREIAELSGQRPHGVGAGGQNKRGVVFESLDSRIHMDSLVSAMRRIGLGVKCRSRWGAGRAGIVGVMKQ